MVRALKVVGALSIGVVLLLGVALIALYRVVQVGELRRFLIEEFERRTQLKVSVGDAALDVGGVVGIVLKDFVLFEPEDARPVIAAKAVSMRVALRPLWQRQIIFDEVRLSSPSIQLVRDETGEIPLMGLLARLLFEQHKEAAFALDLKELRLERGELTFIDHRTEKPGPAVFHFREVALDLRRSRTRELMAAESGSAASRGAEPGLQFGLRAAIEKDGHKGKFTAKGKVLFPFGEFALDKARFDAEARAEALPARLFVARFLGVQSAQGSLTPHLRWRGRLAGELEVEGTVDFQGLQVNAPAIFAGALTPGDGRLEIDLRRTREEVRFSRLDFRSEEMSLSALGALRFLAEDDPYLEVHWTTPFLPLLAARKYLPLKVLKSPMLESLVGFVDQGELRLNTAGAAGRLSEMRRLLELGAEGRVWFDAELREVGGRPIGDGYLPVSGVSGRIILEKGNLYYKGFKGMYGRTRIAAMEGSHQGIFSGRTLLELQMRGEMDLAEAREQLRMTFLPSHLSQLASSAEELGGKAKFDLSLGKKATSPYRLEGQLSLEDARLRMGDVALGQLRGALSISSDEIRAERVAAVLAGSPVYIRASLTRYLSDQPAFDLAFDSPGVRAGVVSRLLLSSGSSEDPGTVRGTIRYQGPLMSEEQRRLSGSLELRGVRFPVELFGEPLREVGGRVRFDGKGIDLQGLRGRLAGFRFDFSGQWRYAENPQLTFTLRSPELDLGLLLSRGGLGTSDWYDRLQARGTLNIEKGRYEGFEFSDLRSDFVLDRRVWRLENFSARSAGGTVRGHGTITDASEGPHFSVKPEVLGVPAGNFLAWFDIGTTRLTGRVNLSGSLDSSGKTGSERKRNLNGAFRLEIEDGTVRRLRLLIRILNLLDLSRWFTLKLPDISQEGIRFRRITGDFKVAKGIYSTQNLLLDSDDLRMTGAGQIDGPKGEADLVVAIRPFPGLDSAVSYIPLIGQGIAAIKNSFLVASFHVTGPMDDPLIVPAPLSTLSEFFFGALAIPKSLIGLPEGEKK